VAKNYKQVYQFRIFLRDVEPPVWRRIQVPETYSFWDLHVAIQDSMGWFDGHLHEFVVKHTFGKEARIGIPDEDTMSGDEILTGWEQGIADYFNPDCRTAEYCYDFGDNWEHIITFEKIVPREKGKRYPMCITGERACPPEDSGDPIGYMELLETLADPDDEEHAEKLEWVGEDFDPEDFDPDEVEFDNPDKRRLESMLFD
jgi:hypothetical protein